jgi:hypothetical protein
MNPHNVTTSVVGAATAQKLGKTPNNGIKTTRSVT